MIKQIINEKSLDIQNHEILLFDDDIKNIEKAKKIGIKSVHVKGNGLKIEDIGRLTDEISKISNPNPIEFDENQILCEFKDLSQNQKLSIEHFVNYLPSVYDQSTGH